MAAVLFVHGAGGGGWEWNAWTRVFAAEGQVVRALDLHPIAEGLAQTQLADYSAQVRAHVEELRRKSDWNGAQPGKVVLIGASLGGLLALMNAEFADALVLVNPMPPAPLNAQLPGNVVFPAVIPWGANASLDGTRRALPDADDAACLYAFRRWRDESGAAMNAARAGIVVAKPSCPLLLIASERDLDVPPTISEAVANWCASDLLLIPNASHVGPLLGRSAPSIAERAVAWLNSLDQKN